MRPSPLPESRPSLLGAVLFAVLAFVIFGANGVIYGEIYQDSLPPQFDGNGVPFRREVSGWWGLVVGVVGAAIAGWGWMASREVRFHIACLSGITCIITAAWHVYCARVAFQQRELNGEYAVGWPGLQLLLEGPVVAGFTATLGIVLILTAMIQDHR